MYPGAALTDFLASASPCVRRAHRQPCNSWQQSLPQLSHVVHTMPFKTDLPSCSLGLTLQDKLKESTYEATCLENRYCQLVGSVPYEHAISYVAITCTSSSGL